MIFLVMKIGKFEISKIHSFTVIDKLQHDQFIELIGNADWVVTDSGGLQEECAFLGIPTLVHRIATERFDGIGANVVLSEWDLEKLTDFLHEYEHLVCKPTEVLDSPSKRVISYLKEWKIL
jgi:UDP-N-acetylglucosamine 2-epimerase (non-hydrolysing)